MNFVLVALVLAADPAEWASERMSPERLDRGYAIVLPGILGQNVWDDNLAAGLEDSDEPPAVEVHDWTDGPLGIGLNLFDGNLRHSQACCVACKVVRYRRRYPGRPVYVVGHSGGARIAVDALENLPEGQSVTGAILVAATMPRRYDLSLAMDHTEEGIHNFYSPGDIVVGQVFGTSVGGTGLDLLSAATFGFSAPSNFSGRETAEYQRKLKQHSYRFDGFLTDTLGGHFVWTQTERASLAMTPILERSAEQYLARAKQYNNDESPRQRIASRRSRPTANSETETAHPEARRRVR